MIINIKTMKTPRKARLVAGGHRTDPPNESVYSSVASGESVHTSTLVAASNDLDILAGISGMHTLTLPQKKEFTLFMAKSLDPMLIDQLSLSKFSTD